MTHIEREKRIVRQMIEVYCRAHHLAEPALCPDCEALLRYAHQRLDRCPAGERKTSCRKCRRHCYAPERREQIRAVMRFTGPRMIFIHPIAALRHLLNELR